MTVSAHRLLIKNPEATLDFYQNILGMKLLKKHESQDQTHYFLSFNEATLELVYRPENDLEVPPQPSKTVGYWKFSVAVDSITSMRELLVKKGISVGEIFEVQGLALLCHLTDPNGYCIELVQKTLKLGSVNKKAANTFNLLTLRVKNLEHSSAFYHSVGMKTIYTYRSEERKMTLAFLSSLDNVDAIMQKPHCSLEEKLWQSPYTLLELQHLDGTQNDPSFMYKVGEDTGFLGFELNIKPHSFNHLAQNLSLSHKTTCTNKKPIELIDPDGYRLTICSTQ